jgi:hypothetical protein
MACLFQHLDEQEATDESPRIKFSSLTIIQCVGRSGKAVQFHLTSRTDLYARFYLPVTAAQK